MTIIGGDDAPEALAVGTPLPEIEKPPSVSNLKSLSRGKTPRATDDPIAVTQPQRRTCTSAKWRRFVCYVNWSDLPTND